MAKAFGAPSDDERAVAIVGVAGRFPGAETIDQLWTNLIGEVDAVNQVGPAHREVLERFVPGDKSPGATYSKWGGLLADSDRFDAAFFQISPREAEMMDPQQRLLLESTWEALESAGRADGSLPSGTGVFVGAMASEYLPYILEDPRRIAPHTITGNHSSVLSNRLSYFLGLDGPSLTVDVACSSSLAALHLAVASLRAGECPFALVGATQAGLAPFHWVEFSQLGALSPSGRCRVYDRSADGYVMAEGVGCLVLRRLCDALQSGDRILGVLRGVAIGHGGRTDGLTAPSAEAQARICRRALADAGVTADEISYVEAHGTGTPLGDPVEIAGLTLAFRPDSDRRQFCAIGSIKSNIGHLESAAGMAGLVKLLQCFHHRTIPANLHFLEPNPNIDFSDSPFFLVERSRPWEADGRRLAAIHASGFGGSIAFAILEEPPKVALRAESQDRSYHVVRLSAKTPDALQSAARRLREFAQNTTDQHVADLAYSLNVGRGLFEHRLCAVASSNQQLVERLSSFEKGDETRHLHSAIAGQRPKVAFLFTGQGAQFANMGRQLWQSSPTFRNALEDCAVELTRLGAIDLIETLYGRDQASLDETAWSQPALFAFEFALAELWRRWGIQPDVVLGHSLGELTAAWQAGVFDLADALFLVARRGRLMQESPPGAMTAVFASAERVSERLRPFHGTLVIAAINGPENIVVSGEEPSLRRFEESLEETGIAVHRLNVRRAFHSPLMDAQAVEFHRATSGIVARSPSMAWIANVTGQVWRTERVPFADDWRDHMLQPVRFDASIRAALDLGVRVFVEIGPTPVLSGMGRRIAEDVGVQAAWIPSLVRGSDDWRTLCDAVAALDVLGVPFDGRGFDADYTRQRVDAPTYPFERKRFWVGRNQGSGGEYSAQGIKNIGAEKQGLPLECVSWKPTVVDASGEPKGLWIVFLDEGERAQCIVDALRRNGCVVVACVAGEKLEPCGSGKWTLRQGNVDDYRQLVATVSPVACPKGIVHAFGLDATKGGLQAPAWDLAALSQALTAFERSPLQVILIASDSTAISANEQCDPAKAAVWGFAKTLAQEYPLWRIVGFDIPADQQIVPALILSSHRVGLLAFREGQWLEPVRESLPRRDLIRRASRHGVVLITGGLGGIGVAVARELVQQGCRHLVLASRSGTTSNEMNRAALEELRHGGALIETPRVDVADEQAVFDLVRGLRERHGWIAGAIHAAGVLSDRLIRTMSASDLESVFVTKAYGAMNLVHALRDDDLDFLVFCSSIVALDGNVGQGAYAAANAAMDAIAANVRASGKNATSIHWGPWAIGMASGPELTDAWTRLGLVLIEERTGAQQLAELCTSTPGHYVVAPRTSEPPISTARLRHTLEKEVRRQEASDEKREQGIGNSEQLEVGSHRRPPPVSVANPRSQEVRGGDSKDKNTVLPILQRLADIFEEVLHLPAEQMDLDTPFKDYGVDSILAEEALIRVRRELDLPALSAPLLFQHPTLRLLALHLEKVIDESGQGSRIRHPTGIGPAEHDTSIPRPVETGSRDIAIVGYAGRFPDAEDANEFWTNLLEQRVSVSPPPAERWELLRRYYPLASCLPPIQNPKSKIQNPPRYLHGGWLTGIDRFDPLFFRMRPAEAERLDPRQRLFLEVAYRALEHGGYGGQRLSGSKTGTFVGIGTQDYSLLEQIPLEEINDSTGVGSAPSVLASRLAYVLDLKGPCVPVDTACSSALVAVHWAIESLRRGECDYAVAGAVHLNLSAYVPIVLDRLGVVSSSGACRSFSADADGILPAEAAGAFLLRRLSDALASGDTIYAVLKGSAVNNDGRTNGIASPNPDAQADVVREAWKDAGIAGDSISYIEAHGTGTRVGDALELQGLSKAFQTPGSTAHRCWVGSVKSNIGHGDIAAGAVGLVKVIEALRHRTLPATPNIGKVNPSIDRNESPLRICESTTPWEGITPLRAGISAFGFSGTNAHLVVEEAPATTSTSVDAQPWFCVFSARSRELLHRHIQRQRDYLALAKNVSIADIASTLAVGRMHQRHRLGVICNSVTDLVDRLARWLDANDNIQTPGVMVCDTEQLPSSFEALEMGGLGDHALRVARDWLAGQVVDWPRFFRGQNVHPVELPGSEWDRVRCWFHHETESPWPSQSDRASTMPTHWRLDWQSVVPDREPISAEPNRWYVIGDLDLLPDLPRSLPAKSVPITPLCETNRLEQLGEMLPSDASSILWIASSSNTANCESAVQQCAAVARGVRRRGLVRLALVTLSSNDDVASAALASLRAATRVLAKEHPDCRVSIFDVDSENALNKNTIAEELRRGAAVGEYRIRDGEILAPAVVRALPIAGSSSLRHRATYLITGAGGGLGRSLALWLSREYQARLVLLHRTIGDLSAWQRALDDAGVERIHIEANVSDPSAVREAIFAAKSAFGRIDGVFHLAGRAEHRRLVDMTAEGVRRTISGKVEGAMALDEATRDDPPELFVLFSSVAGIEGNIFQGAYSAANAWLDAFALWRAGQGRATKVIDWGLISGSGMGAEFADRSKGRESTSLTINEAWVGLPSALAQDEARIIVSASPLNLSFPKLSTDVNGHNWIERLKMELAKTLDIPPDAIDARGSFIDFGMDSKLAVTFIRRLQRFTGGQLSATLPFDYPNLTSLAQHLETISRAVHATKTSPPESADFRLSTGRAVRWLERSY